MNENNSKEAFDDVMFSGYWVVDILDFLSLGKKSG